MMVKARTSLLVAGVAGLSCTLLFTSRTGPAAARPVPAAVVPEAIVPSARRNGPARKSRAARPVPKIVRSAAKPAARIKMDFRDAPIDRILAFYSRVSGLSVIKDPGLTGTATIENPRPLSLAAAMDVLSAVLGSRGYRLERTPTLMIVAPAAAGESFGGTARVSRGRFGRSGSGFGAGVGFGAGGGRGGPSRDRTQVFVLKYAGAKSLASIVNDLFKNAARPIVKTPGPESGAVTSAARASSDDYSNAVVVTGPPDQLRQIADLIAKIDQPIGSKESTRVIHVRYVDVQSMANVVANVLLATANNGAGAVSTSSMDSRQRMRMTARFGTTSLVNGEVAPLPETNTLVVTAPPETLDLIQKVVTDLDRPQPIRSTGYVRRLTSADATEVSQLLNQMYGRSGQSFARTGAYPGGTPGMRRNSTGFASNSAFGRTGPSTGFSLRSG